MGKPRIIRSWVRAKPRNSSGSVYSNFMRKRKYEPAEPLKEYGEWTVVEPGEPDGDKQQYRRFLCRCSCGKEKLVRENSLIRGASSMCKSCSTRINATTHGDVGTKLHGVWAGIRRRCHKSFHKRRYYFDKGITVCQEWDSFVAFRDWALVNGYQPGLQIDRIKGHLGYSPENCRWANSTTQNRNRSNTTRVTAFGETKCVTEWAEDKRCVVRLGTLRGRIDRGEDPEQAITTLPKRRQCA